VLPQHGSHVGTATLHGSHARQSGTHGDLPAQVSRLDRATRMWIGIDEQTFPGPLQGKPESRRRHAG
jgi:hypothetical protein